VTGPVRPVRAARGRIDPTGATRSLARRVEPGDIVLVDHLDLDRVSAQALAAARPVAVVNVRDSLSGRHPAGGPAVLLDAGIALFDDAGQGLLSAVREGDPLRIHDGEVFAGETVLGTVRPRLPLDIAADEDAARSGMTARLEAVGSDAATFLSAHELLLIEGGGLPSTSVRLAGRTVLVIAPGERSAAELAALRPWIKDRRPVVVAADDGAQVALSARVRPDLLVGDRGDLTAAHLRGVNVIAGHELPQDMAAVDVAVLLAAEAEAALIVVTGSAASYDELLDRDSQSAASLLAVRLRAGGRLVDAPAVAELHRPAISLLGALALVLCGAVALAAAVVATPGGRTLLHQLRASLPW
jgi:uncharacterized membrane-anchored protein